MTGRSSGPVVASRAAGALIVLAALVAACGPGTRSAQPIASAIAAGSGSPVPGPSGSGQPGPKATAWPGNAVLGIEALGAADGQILAAINDFNRGVATEDLALMRRAADGLAGLDVLLPNLEKISLLDAMRPFADRYGAAIRAISAAAKALRDAIDAADAAAITGSSQQLVTSLSMYTAIQSELASWVEQSIEQRRLLLR
jgi:hypothetical protein